MHDSSRNHEDSAAEQPPQALNPSDSNESAESHQPKPPTISSSSTSIAAAPRLNPRSCVTCRRRKVRCNKQDPCANCVRASIDCIFPGPGRAPRKSRKPPDAELLTRLRRLEGVVQNLGVHVEENGMVSPTLAEPGDARSRVSDHQSSQSPSSGRSDSKRGHPEKQLGRLVVSEDRSRYVSNAFWTAMSDEIAEMQDLLDPSGSEEEDESLSPVSEHVNHQAFLFGYSSVMTDLRSLHPTPSQTFILWEVFKENVDPVVRILHRPTARTILMNAASNLDRLSKPAEALLFSIYFGAVVSLTPEQCQQLLDESKETLLKKYRFATEQALARADLLNTSSLMCLQAFCFFLIFVRHCDDSRLVWALGGLALHLAQALGIHRDGTHFGLNPFDTEMRRRLWWHLSLMDNRSAEDQGTDPTFTEQFYDTKIPSNIDDEDIYPGMPEPPQERLGATEMTFCLVRFELSTFSRRFTFTAPGTLQSSRSDLTLEEKEKLIDDCHRVLEEKYLRHCNMSTPIYWVAATVTRLILAKLWLMVHHPRTLDANEGLTMAPACRDRLFITSVEVIEFSHLLESNENTAKWGWLFRTYMQWQSVAFALSELCVRPPAPETERAWRAVESVYDERIAKNHKLQRGMLWKPLRQLLAKAKAKRAEQELQVGQRKDTFFTELTSETPVARFLSDYPENMISNTMEALGMDIDASFAPYRNSVDVQHQNSRQEVGNVPIQAQSSAQAMPNSATVSPVTLKDDTVSLDSSEMFNCWSPMLDDFTIRPEPYQRMIMNLQQEWF